MKSPTPSARTDFKSTLALAFDDESMRLRSGLSMFDTLERAQKKAKAMAWLGAWVAAVDVTGLTYERTTKSRGHYTVWGTPEELAGRVIAVYEVYE